LAARLQKRVKQVAMACKLPWEIPELDTCKTEVFNDEVTLLVCFAEQSND
jgi:hypothetical protein